MQGRHVPHLLLLLLPSTTSTPWAAISHGHHSTHKTQVSSLWVLWAGAGRAHTGSRGGPRTCVSGPGSGVLFGARRHRVWRRKLLMVTAGSTEGCVDHQETVL